MIRTGQVVTRIENHHSPRSTNVCVTTERGDVYRARHAIVTLPIGVLQESEKLFSPLLPLKKRAAINAIGVGKVVKVIVRATSCWGATGFISTDYPIPTWWAWPTREGHRGALIGWAGGRAAIALENSDPDEIRSLAIWTLRRIFPDACLSIRRDDIYVVNWMQEPFSKGAYSYDSLSLQTRDEHRNGLGEPEWGGSLLFAGEATEVTYHGMVHSAVTSGRRAASYVVDAKRERAKAT